ncbi:uncharacterized protein BJ212DRAFT_1294722 [Suillus subaureus]|uniref:Uncharacterized protein n=1 Tax=Suillus subaureus TaxID=48587 RepID=A0A9P7EQN5_9AGAM|nr:uncharacterized protein BJ212DRAFT_1294722 [Suillus subaureus]KAG1827450.1 hypothetical protein BJ212DRAFT_1294722 [Suillus subaureus]
MPPSQAKAWSLVVVLAAAALAPRGAFAQTSTVTCLSSFSWMDNSLKQNPCVVASYLESVCGAINFAPLPSGYYYAPPSAASANTCVCNTVTYSMVSACADCQNATYLEYPNDIPTGTKVPNWAYLNVTGGFDPVAAQSNGDLPESTATNVPTITVTYSTTLSASLTGVSTFTSSSGAATGSSTSLTGVSTSLTSVSTFTSSSGAATGSSTSASDSTSSNVGAIAGGVVGGIAGAAAIIGLATWYFFKRRRSSTTPSAAFNDIGGGPGQTQGFYSTNATTFPMAEQSRLYDPSDPTTFPGRLHPLTGPIASSSNTNLNPSMPSPVFPQQSRSGQYAGIPQV